MIRKARLFSAVFLMAACSSLIQAGPLFEYHLGNAWTTPAELSIEQEGEEELAFNTRFETRGFKLPPYYSIRGGWQVGNCSYEAEMIHHKLFARDLPDEVEHFEITHGLDFLFLNRSCPLENGFRWRLGGGMALANPHSTVRGQTWFEQGGFTMPILNEAGYHPTGPFVQAAVQKTFRYGISLEAKWAGGWVDVPVADGRASMWHQSLHFLVGISFGRN